MKKHSVFLIEYCLLRYGKSRDGKFPYGTPATGDMPWQIRMWHRRGTTGDIRKIFATVRGILKRMIGIFRAFDHSTAEAVYSVVQYGELPFRNGTLFFGSPPSSFTVTYTF